jgi:phosphoadenosine phosphosulfate reductase
MSQNIKRAESVLSMDAKVRIANAVIADVFNNFRRPVVVWSAGKDSTVMLHLVREYLHDSSKTIYAIFIDHGMHYPETIKMLNEVAASWNVKIITARNDDVINNVDKDGYVSVQKLSKENKDEIDKLNYHDETFKYGLDSEVANHMLKTVPMKHAIMKNRFDCAFVGVRWDENAARSSELFMHPRENPNHVRIHPILPFIEADIWKYVFEFKLPIHPLYYKGYRSIDGVNDSSPIDSRPAWEQDLEKTEERAGRSQDKEGIMEKLRELGYM